MKIKNIILLLIVLVLVSCGGSKLPDSTNPEEIFQAGVRFLENKDYNEAKQMFDLIIIQYPASQWADDAQFYLGEVSFRKGEYIVAAFSYNRLRRQFPGSPFTKEALYKTAMCYYNMSPTYDRDQEYTRKAIEAFQEFQYLYPDDELYKEASNKITELRNKLAYREYFTAELYMKLQSPISAVIYYDSVINSYSDTDYFEPAMYGKISALIYMKKYKEASSTFLAYKSNFPNSEKIQILEKMLEGK